MYIMVILGSLQYMNLSHKTLFTGYLTAFNFEELNYAFHLTLKI